MSALPSFAAISDVFAERSVGLGRAIPVSLAIDTMGKRIRWLRLKRGFTLAHVADTLGVSKPTVWAWERGKCRPHPARLAAIAAVLEADPEDLEGTPVSTGHAADLIEECRERIAAACGTKSSLVRILVEL